jgi:hypothetical protein
VATPAPPIRWDSTQSNISNLGQLLPVSSTVSLGSMFVHRASPPHFLASLLLYREVEKA